MTTHLRYPLEMKDVFPRVLKTSSVKGSCMSGIKQNTFNLRVGKPQDETFKRRDLGRHMKLQAPQSNA